MVISGGVKLYGQVKGLCLSLGVISFPLASASCMILLCGKVEATTLSILGWIQILGSEAAASV